MSDASKRSGQPRPRLTPMESDADGKLNPRQRPQSLEAEQGLLGALLVDNEVYHRVSDFLRPEHLFEPLHQRIYARACEMIERSQTAAPLTLAPYMAQDEDLNEIGGADYLVSLAAAGTSTYLALDYARIIYDMAVRRGLIDVGEELVAEAYDAAANISPESLIDEAEQRLYKLSQTGRAQGGFQGFNQALAGALEMAENAFRRVGNLSGLATGLSDLDQKLGGLQKSDLIILAGRPGMGKTALACNIAFNIARRHLDGGSERGGGQVAFFSLEMSAEQLAMRLLAEQSGVPSADLRRGDFNETDWRTVARAVEEINTIPLFIDDSGGLPIATLAARARRQKQSGALDLIIVDYLQLVTAGAAKRFDNRVQEISEITQTLKALAKELNVPVIALSQLSRQVEQRTDKRPQLADLRESGSIEQDADVVMFVYRESYYLNMAQPDPNNVDEFQKWATKMEQAGNRAEVIIGKQRHGPTGTVNLAFEDNITRFSDFVDDSRLPERQD